MLAGNNLSPRWFTAQMASPSGKNYKVNKVDPAPTHLNTDIDA